MRFLVIFLSLVMVLLTLELLPPVQEAVVLPFTAALTALSAGLMRIFDPMVAAQGKLIWSQASGFAVSVEAGCNGVEAAILLIAAILAFPARWAHKFTGILVGLLTVQLLNVLRIITLFYLGQWDRTLFEWAHLYLWQALIALDVLVVFLLWIRWQARRASQVRPAS